MLAVYCGLNVQKTFGEDLVNSKLCSALICGTSTCHMAVERSPHFVPGVWGPYWSAMVPGMWLSEGGQSATGCLVDHIINSHPAAGAVRSALPEGV